MCDPCLEVRDFGGGLTTAAVGDLSDQAVVEQFVGSTLETYGTIDVLVNNAGIMNNMIGPHELSDEMWERLISVNFTKTGKMMRAVIPHMLTHAKGAIVNTACEVGLRGSAAGTAYTVSMHGIIGLTKSAAIGASA